MNSIELKYRQIDKRVKIRCYRKETKLQKVLKRFSIRIKLKTRSELIQSQLLNGVRVTETKLFCIKIQI
jgi:hypothetical protein